MEILSLKSPSDQAAAAQAVSKRLSVRKLQLLERAGWLSRPETFRLILPQRTLSDRVQKRELLSGDESDKLMRVSRITEHAVQTFGDQAKAMQWLRRENPRFGGETPLGLMRTEAGGRVIEEALIQLDEGVFV
jgi:putative toxin-antitoxin system antitoxin component (TIGR02293 family)